MEILILSENIHIDREQICIAASQLAYRQNYNFKVVYKKFNNKILKFIDKSDYYKNLNKSIKIQNISKRILAKVKLRILPLTINDFYSKK